MTTASMDRDPGLIAPTGVGAHGSGVSWPAIFAGALGASALSLILVVLGVGLGFSAVSPWSQDGVSATTFGVSTILWLTFTAIVASGTGGYLAGRLRHRFVGTQRDEVYFRDTAHGFLSWATATLITAAVLTSVIGAIVGGAAKTATSAVGSVGSAALTGGAAAAGSAAGTGGSTGNVPGMGYLMDSLFRRDAAASPQPASTATSPPASDASAPNGSSGSNTAEVTRIFVQSLQTGSLSADDQRYVAQLVAQKTGLSPDDANKRVSDAFARVKSTAEQAATKAREAADTARKSASYASLWLFVSLLIGAFVASLAATFGGRQRDL